MEADEKVTDYHKLREVLWDIETTAHEAYFYVRYLDGSTKHINQATINRVIDCMHYLESFINRITPLDRMLETCYNNKMKEINEHQSSN